LPAVAATREGGLNWGWLREAEMTKVVLAAALAGVVVLQQAHVLTETQHVAEGTADRATTRQPGHAPRNGVFVIATPATGGETAPVQSVPSPELRQKLTEDLRALRESVASRTPAVERGPCNMPIVRANPAVDPKMVVPLRTEGVDAKIRVIEPGVCGKRTEGHIR
jgi:hypothetical protein